MEDLIVLCGFFLLKSEQKQCNGSTMLYILWIWICKFRKAGNVSSAWGKKLERRKAKKEEHVELLLT